MIQFIKLADMPSDIDSRLSKIERKSEMQVLDFKLEGVWHCDRFEWLFKVY